MMLYESFDEWFEAFNSHTTSARMVTVNMRAYVIDDNEEVIGEWDERNKEGWLK